MKLYGVAGWKNSGKTGLVERLVAEFTARGLTVSTVKHAHHGFDIDRPGKDSYRHREAGAREVLVSSSDRWALMHENHGGEPDLAELLAHLAPVDLVIVEGFKHDPHPKIVAHRIATGQPPFADPLVRAIASDVALPGQGVPVLDLDATVEIADFIAADLGLP